MRAGPGRRRQPCAGLGQRRGAGAAGLMLLLAGLAATQPGRAEWGGWIEVEGRGFPDAPLYPVQSHRAASFALRPEYRTRADGYAFAFVPFLRVDSEDRERTHVDLREANVRFDARGLSWLVGIGQETWGVAESYNPVDIVNQIDFVEDIATDEKLGQPMIQAKRLTSFGAVQLLMLPGFRERTFPGEHGRLYLPVDFEHPIYQSSQKEWHVDWALRWAKTFGTWDLGLSYFWGTRRDPRLEPDPSKGLASVYYDLIHQLGLDLQGAMGNWTLKLEGVYRDTPVQRYAAAVAGAEYTLHGVADTAASLSLFAEYTYNGTDNTLATLYQNDVFAGARLALNDLQSTELELGILSDLEEDSLLWRLEASRRLGEDWKLKLSLQAFPRTASGEPAYWWRNDGYARLQLVRYF
jgi:hypothetical protein